MSGKLVTQETNGDTNGYGKSEKKHKKDKKRKKDKQLAASW